MRRFNRKNPTSPKLPYNIYHNHTGECPLNSKIEYPNYDPWVQVTAIDPAIKNCAIRVERRTYKDGFLIVETLLQIKFDFSVYNDNTNYYTNSLNLLMPYLEYFITSQYILIETQMVINYDLVRLSQHLITFLTIFTTNKGLKPLIIEIDSRLKSRLFNAPKMNRLELKKWAVENAIKILSERNDIETINFIMASAKKDDHGDTVCYTEAWWKILSCEEIYNAPISAAKLLEIK
jgi:hypothetical protein